MSPLVDVLAGIWLALAVIGGAVALFLLGVQFLHVRVRVGEVAFARGMVTVFAIGGLWALPLAIASRLVLTQRRAGIGMLLALAGINTLLWPLYWLHLYASSESYYSAITTPGPNSTLNEALSLVMILFSAFTVVALTIDLRRDGARCKGGG